MRVSNTKIKHEGIASGFNGESYPLMTAMMVYIESGAKPLASAQVGTIPSPAIRINWFTGHVKNRTTSVCAQNACLSNNQELTETSDRRPHETGLLKTPKVDGSITLLACDTAADQEVPEPKQNSYNQGQNTHAPGPAKRFECGFQHQRENDTTDTAADEHDSGSEPTPLLEPVSKNREGNGAAEGSTGPHDYAPEKHQQGKERARRVHFTRWN